MIKHFLSISLGLAAANLAWADLETCTTVADTAAEAGLTSLLDVVTDARPALEESDEGLAFLAALAATDVRPADEQVTIFAPTNAAFEALAQAGGELTPALLADVLLSHAFSDSLTSETILEAIEAGGGTAEVITLSGAPLAITTDGESIFIQTGVLPGDGAAVVTPDVLTCAGVVHVIDTVLVPPSVVSPAGSATGMGPGMAPDMGPAMAPAGECTAIDATATEAGLTSLVEAITFAVPGLGANVIQLVAASEQVPADERITVFAPTNEAFDAAADAFGGSLPSDEDVIAQVLLNHMVAGELSSAAILEALGDAGGSAIVPTLAGSELLVTTSGGGLFLQSRGLEGPGAEVTAADVSTCAGVVHVIDTVLLPTQVDGTEVPFVTDGMMPAGGPMEGPEMAPGMGPEMGPGMGPDMGPDMAPGMGPEMGPDLAPGMVAAGVAPLGVGEDCAPLGEVAVEAGLTSLVSALTTYEQQLNETDTGAALLNSANVLDPVPLEDRITVFAPTNEAFDAAGAAFGGDLPGDAVPDVLLNHIVSGEVTAEAILALVGQGGGSAEVTTVGGGTLFVTTVEDALYVQSEGLEAPGALVTAADVVTCSGPVHVVDTVLLPTFPDGTTVTFPTEGPAAPGPAPAVAPGAAVTPTQDRGGVALPPDDTDADVAGGDVADGGAADGEAADGEVADGDVVDADAAAGVWGSAGGLGVAVAIASILAVAL